MSTKRKPPHTNVVLERQHDTNGLFPVTLVVMDRDVASLNVAQKRARELAAAKPGSVFLAARFWPGVLAQVKTVARLVDPDKCEAQQPEGAGMEANNKQT